MQLAGGRYELREVIGQGGFATVWRGRDTALEVDRAVKLLHPDLGDRAAFRERLRAEARAMARLAHPNILTVHDIGIQDGQDWFVMDLVTGGSLADWQQRGGRLPPALAVRCVIQVLSALGTAHAAGIVHRDVKPQNVLLDADGRCRLADFGIALLESEERLRSTKTGATLGSLSYMAPEQRLSAKDVGPTADLYATGSTLYALLTDATAIDLFTADPASPRWLGVPEALRPILQRTTQHDPGARYQSAAALAAALEATLAQLPPDEAESWLAKVQEAQPDQQAGGALPTMDLLQQSTRQALTLLGEQEESGAAPTAVPATQAVESTLFEPPPGPTGPEGGPGPASGQPALLRRLAPIGALLLMGLGLWAWAPWRSPAPPSEPASTPESPSRAPEADRAGPPPEEPRIEPLATVPPSDAVADLEPGEPADEPETAPTPAGPSRAASHDAGVPPPAAPHPPAMADSTISGRWRGSYGGKDAVLELRGPDDALTGTLVITFFGNAQSSRVRGRLQGDRLVLEDQDRAASYAGSHAGTLGPDGRITGQTTTFGDGRVVSFSFWR
jgi:serine/threonine protein kinase